jgi:acyl carrier protein
MKTSTKAAPRPVDPRVPAHVRAAIVTVCGCDDLEVRLETPIAQLPGFDVAPASLDLTELVTELEERYTCDLSAWEDQIDATWPTGTVLTVVDLLHKADLLRTTDQA